MRRSVAVLAPHAILLVAAWLLVGRDALRPFGGAGLVTSIVPLLAVVVAGAVRAARGIAGGKPLLLASDLGIAAVAGVTWAFSGPHLLDDPDLLLESTIVVAVVSAVALLALPSGRRATIEREGWSWALPAAIVVVDLAAIGSFSLRLGGAAVGDTLPILGTYALVLLVGDGVALVAWWWACRWPLGIGAIASAGAWLAAIVANPDLIAAQRTDAAIAAIAIALGLVAVAVGPVLRPSSPHLAAAPAGPAGPAEPASTRQGSRIPRPGAIWSIVGAILYPLLALGSLFPVVSESSGLGQAAPGQDLLVTLTLVSVVAVPVSTVILLVAARRPGGRWPAAILLGTGVIVFVDLILAALGYDRFRYLFLVVGPAALVGLGGFAFLWPRIGRLAGSVCSLAAAGITLAWFAGTIVVVVSFALDPGNALGSIPAGLLLPLAIAWEGDRAVRMAEAETPVAPTPASPEPPASAGSPAEIAARPGTTGPADPLDTPAGGP